MLHSLAQARRVQTRPAAPLAADRKSLLERRRFASMTKTPEESPKKFRALRYGAKALGFTADATSSVVGAVFKVLGSVVLVLLVLTLIAELLLRCLQKNRAQAITQ